ncbi:MAG: HPr(Ser) kinase/phosphatase [Lachnospiraceae bacterium]|nr:HPr(Ser) kinase/phosphatase [Lachnospiraceae bacterium]MBF1040949.1 HPr(Ser) kinase/phosphatase [Lachnospiraceae bacterium]
MESVKLEEVVKKMKFELLTPNVDFSETEIRQCDINRPALQLTGYFEHDDASRMQIIGMVEYSYMSHMTQKQKDTHFQKLLDRGIPCIVFCRNLQPDQSFIDLATNANVPLFITPHPTSQVMAEVIRWLNVRLAPCIRIHGVLCDVYGEGLLITGESGIGKSEAALELIKRGHRLVSDDVVEIRKVSGDTLIGSAPEITKHFIELRGIGIIDVKTLFGVSSVRDTSSIDLVIRLEEWDRDKDYDRFGLEEHFTEYLGKKIICHDIPIRPGRNLAIICEAAAVNHRQKKMGYNAAQELYNRVQNTMKLNQNREEAPKASETDVTQKAAEADKAEA